MYINTKIALLFIIISLGTDGFCQKTIYHDLASRQFSPEGWTKEYLTRQVNGLGSHPEESGFPFNTGMWTENMDYRMREYPGGDDWWPYEQTAYYLDGSLRCAYLTGSESLMKRVEKNIDYILAHADDEGILHAGNLGFDREGWPMVIIMRMLIEQYKNTSDQKLLAAIEKHFKAVYSKTENFKIANISGFEIRPVLQVEQLCALYGITDDTFYIKAAEKLYTSFQEKSEAVRSKNKTPYITSSKGMNEGLRPAGHAVTYHEFMKLPAILYMYTGKKCYKTAFYKAYQMLEEDHELVDGGFANHEGLAGKGSNESAEACSLIDFGWTSGWALLATGDPMFADKMEKILYNAAFSLISKDFKAYQYYQMPNLLISTNASSFYNDDVAWGAVAKGRLCYRPGHDTECCAGNIHRMLPTFINRSCLITDQSVKVALYLPGTIKTKLKHGSFDFTQDTNYPFEHRVRITINKAPKSKVALGLRVPQWADSYQIFLNGKPYATGSENTVFKMLEQKFKTGDIVEITFDTTPKTDDRGHGIAISYGPLIFSYPIEAIMRKSTVDTGHKCSADFPAYEYFPKDLQKGTWAIALSKHLDSAEIKVIKTKNIGYPWDYKNAPFKIKVKAKTVNNWQLTKWIEPSAYPTKVELGHDIEVELWPEAATKLRISEFPKGDF